MAMVVVFAVMAGMMAGQFSHAVGVAPILAALLCAACFLRRRDIAIVGLIGVLAQDLLTGFSWFTLVRLAGVLSVIGIVMALRVQPSLKSLLVGLGISAPTYHLVLVVGDWITHTCSQEPWTPAGLVNTLMSSLPYIQRSLLGDLVLTGAFLGLYALAGSLVARRWPLLIPQPSRQEG